MNDNQNRVELIDTDEKFAARKAEWIAFENQINNIQLFYSFEFLFPFWISFKNVINHKFGNTKTLYILFFYKRNCLTGIFPFCIITRKRKIIFNVKYLEFVGQQFFANYMDIITNSMNSDDLNYVLKWINYNTKVDIINLGYIPDFSILKKIGEQHNFFPFSYSPEAHFKNNKSFLEYKRNVLTTNYRGIVNNALNRIKKENLSFEVIFKKYEHEDLSEIIKISESKLKDGKYNVYGDPYKFDFIKKIYTNFNAKVCFIKLDNYLISYQIFIYYKDQNMWFDISYDRDYKKYRPGILQYIYGLMESYNNSDSRNILGWGDDFHKLGFCNQFYILNNYLKCGNGFLAPIWYYLQKKTFIQTKNKFKKNILPKLQERISKIKSN